MSVNPDDILIYLVIFVAVLFICLVMITILSFIFPKKSSSYINSDKKSISASIRRQGDNMPYKPQRTNEERTDKNSNYQPSHSVEVVDNKNDTANDKLDSTLPSRNEFIKDPNDSVEQAQIQQSLNDDGTVKTEIEFDSLSEDSTAIAISQKYEYLETANNGQFRKLLSSDEKCFFRTWEENGIRKFEFHGNVDKALANINAIFDDVCDIEGKQNGSSQIFNVEPGTLNSQLKVEKRAKIKLV